MDYILGIDQSTQGTKALLFDNRGELICRTDLSHRQIVNGKGWVEHDGEEIYRNTVQAVKDLVEKAGIDKSRIAGLGISNQRETAIAWNRETGPYTMQWYGSAPEARTLPIGWNRKAWPR